jgi:transposase
MEEQNLLSIFGISGLNDLYLETDDSSIFLHGSLPGLNRCPKCQSCHIHRKSKNHRLLHLPPVGGKPAKLQVLVQKQRCVSCTHSWWPKASFVAGQEHMTQSFVNYALALLQFGTVKDVSNHLGVNWNVIKKIHKKFLANHYKEIDVSKVQYISIDEFAVAKRHKYMTTIVDIPTGRILYAIEGRKKDDIGPALKELKKKPPSLKQLQWI